MTHSVSVIWNLVQNSSWYPHVSRVADHHHVRIRPARVKPARLETPSWWQKEAQLI